MLHQPLHVDLILLSHPEDIEDGQIVDVPAVRANSGLQDWIQARQANTKHRNKMKNKIKHGAWVSNPPEYLFNSDTFYTNNTTNDGKIDFGNDVFVDDVDLSGMKVYNNKNVRLSGETSIKRKVKQDNAKLPVLPPISMITPCAVISGGHFVRHLLSMHYP